jgi:GMP synthase-like glutamine amidotransferase
MKILLINNNTRHLKSLSASLKGHEVEIQIYQPGLDFHDEGKDLIILSGGGGEGLEIYDHVARRRLWYQDEMEFVLRNQKPMIGICMGFEVICAAYGQKIYQTPVLTQGYKTVQATLKGRKTTAKNRLNQYESHYWEVHSAPKGFEVLAESPTGIEIIKKDNIFASQFHPENGGTLTLNSLINQVSV